MFYTLHTSPIIGRYVHTLQHLPITTTCRVIANNGQKEIGRIRGDDERKRERERERESALYQKDKHAQTSTSTHRQIDRHTDR